MARICRDALVAVGALLALAGSALAQGDGDSASPPWNLQPVFEQNAVDGVLLGLQGDLTVYGLTPALALGYGLDSGHFRYRAGASWHGVSGSLYDWASTPLLGRTGEAGLALKLGTGSTRLSVAAVRPWSLEEDGATPPRVSYFSGTSHKRWDGPFDLSLELRADFTLGALAGGGNFRSMEHALKLRWGDLRLGWSAGKSSNPGGLAGFAFSQVLRGYDEALKGQSFWRARLERRVPLLSAPVELPPLPFQLPGPARSALEDLTFRVEISAFGEALSVAPVPGPVEQDVELSGPQNRLGWGAGLVFSLGNFEFRVDLFFNHEGQMTHLFG